MRVLCHNALTTVGTNQFLEHTRLMTEQVKDVIREQNPLCAASDTVSDAMIKMTESRLGAVTIEGDDGGVKGVFTDGDLRRNLQEHGSGVVQKSLAELGFTEDPITIDAHSLLYDAMAMFEKSHVDTIIVVDDGKPVGIIDIQDIVSKDLFGG